MNRQAGFSLIEVVVASALMVLIMAACLRTLNDAVHATEGVTLMADTQENLRAGMNYIVQDLTQAGEGIPQGGIPITPGAIVWPGTGGKFPTAWGTIPAIAPGPSLGATTTTSGIPSDTITLMYADTSIWLSIHPINDATHCPNGSVKTSGTAPNAITTATFDSTCVNINGINIGDLILLQSNAANCNNAPTEIGTAACISNLSTSGATTALMTVSNVAGQVVTFNPGDAFGLNGVAPPGGGTQPVTASRIWMISYYLNATTNPQRPLLMRQVNLNTANEVGEVIENMQFFYDILNPGASPPALLTPTEQENPTFANLPYIRDVYVLLYARSENIFSISKQYFRNNLVTVVSARGLNFYNQFQ
jgi:prepilin-type N-terminal cleavage/methylation domain-containing protein